MTFDSAKSLDITSWQLLEALQEDARLSYAELGRRVGLSPPAAAERHRAEINYPSEFRLGRIE